MVFQSMIIAFSMYSKIPMMKIEWTHKNMKYALCFFPLVGLVLGGIVYSIGNLGVTFHWNSLFFASMMTLIPVIITGGIHLDGFLDTIDALSSYGDKEKKLEILKDPHAGAFAIIGGISYFVLSVGLWSEFHLESLGILCISYTMSRTMSAFSIVTFPLAKKSGLVATFQEGAHKRNVRAVMIAFYIFEVIAMVIIQPQIGIGMIFTGLLVFSYYYFMSKKKFGGITGDLAGYFLQVFEISMLISATIIGSIIF